MINLFEELQPVSTPAASAATAKPVTIFDSFFIGTFLLSSCSYIPGQGGMKINAKV
jgi:hypothetical protein